MHVVSFVVGNPKDESVGIFFSTDASYPYPSDPGPGSRAGAGKNEWNGE